MRERGDRADLAIDTIRPIAMRWVKSARARTDRNDPLVKSALETNFAWKRVDDHDRNETFAFVSSHLASIEIVLADAERLFRRTTKPVIDAPAYVYEGIVWFTRTFTLDHFGPNCLAAMVVHESVHVFDARSGEPTIHISEWDEPTFSAIPPELQVHNPSAYASYSAQIHHGALAWPRDVRFGAGRPKD
jgi:hypothetical protein